MGRPFAGYRRVSRVGGREHLISPEEQASAIEGYASVHGIEIVMLEPELDVSGGSLRRPILDRIIAGIEAGEFDGVIVKDLSRLSRLSLTDALGLIDHIESAGGRVISIDENFDASTPAGEKARSDFLSLHRMMRRIYGDRIAGAKERAVRLGIWPLPVVPIGYVKGEDRRLHPGPDAPRVVRAFEKRADGEPWRVIGGVLGRGQTGAGKAIRNRVYLGELHYGEFFNPTAHEPLVSRELFEAAQISHPAPVHLGGREYLLAGVMRCAGCRGLLTGATQNGTWSGYRCMSSLAAGKCPAPALIAASIAEPYLEGIVRHRLRSYSVTEQSDGLTEARRELAEAEHERDEFIRGVQAAGVGADQVAEGLRLRVERVEEAVEALARSSSGPMLGGDAVEAYEGLDVAGRRQVLGGAFGVVWVWKGRGPAASRIKISDAVPGDLPRAGRGRATLRSVDWEDTKEPSWVLAAKCALEGED